MYAKCIKRILDMILSFLGLVILSPLLLALTVIGAVKFRGNPFFTQPRPGKNEKIFRMIKFRSMTNARDAEGNLLPDAQRLTPYGHFLRATSADELPELLNILIGQMSIVGPRPQLVRDMVFMTPEQRKRHSVRPGLTGLAQVSGRNALRWENKLHLDLQYISDITFRNDFKIVRKTVKIILFGGETSDETEVKEDLGDYLLNNDEIGQREYEEKQQQAKELLKV